MQRTKFETPINIYSDPNWAWMRSYSAVVENDRWSMSVMIICNDGLIRKILRDVDPPKASQMVMDVIESIT